MYNVYIGFFQNEGLNKLLKHFSCHITGNGISTAKRPLSDALIIHIRKFPQ